METLKWVQTLKRQFSQRRRLETEETPKPLPEEFKTYLMNTIGGEPLRWTVGKESWCVIAADDVGKSLRQEESLWSAKVCF